MSGFDPAKDIAFGSWVRISHAAWRDRYHNPQRGPHRQQTRLECLLFVLIFGPLSRYVNYDSKRLQLAVVFGGNSGVYVYLPTYLGWGASSSNLSRLVFNLGPIFGTSCVCLGLVGELGASSRHFFALVFNLGPNLGLLFE